MDHESDPERKSSGPNDENSDVPAAPGTQQAAAEENSVRFKSKDLFYICSIAFGLGSLFSLGLLTFVVGGFSNIWWATYQLGFFVAAWAAFHFGEFATTAGWNFEKCTVDCES